MTEEKATVEKALITHWHHDHVKGIPDLLKICPKAKVYKHQPDEGQEDIKDGQVFQVEGATLRAVHTPGHTADHMVFIFEEENAIFTGDSEFSLSSLTGFRRLHGSFLTFSDVLGHGTAVFEDLRAYLSSLHKMQDLVSGRGYPGHGAVIGNATARIAEYIRHRQQREDEVMRVLRSGKLDEEGSGDEPERGASWTPMELVKVIYRDVPESLHVPASHGVLQVLMKLEAEGKVQHDTGSGRWSVSTRGPVP